MPQKERLRVWRGELRKTSGGLTKADLIKNKRGKLVSKKKSMQSKKGKENNLAKGGWLRKKGDQFMSKGLTKKDIERKPKKDVVPPMPKKEEPKPEVVNPPKKKKKAVPKITKSEPIKPGEVKSSNVSVGNIVTRPKRKRKKRVLYNAS